MPKKIEKATGAPGKGRVSAKKKALTSRNRVLGPVESDILADAKMYLKDPEKGALYRWAKLVMQRYEAGRSIANAKKWLDLISSGGIDPEYIE